MSSKTKFNDIYVEKYTERSIVVRGDTRQYKECLKKLGGKYNSRLRGEPGWIFSKSKQEDVVNFIKKGERLSTEEEIKEGEKRTKEWEHKRKRIDVSTGLSQGMSSLHQGYSLAKGEDLKFTNSSSTRDVVPPSEYSKLVNMLNILSEKMERMDYALSLLLTDKQKKKLEEKLNPQKQPQEVPLKGPRVINRVNKTKPDENDFDIDSDSEASSTEEASANEFYPKKRLLR